MMRRHRAGSANNPPPPPVPALFINTATSPKASKTDAFRRCTSSGLAHVDSEGPDRVGALGRLTQFGGCGLERLPVRIGHAHFHAERGELGRSGEANAAGRAGDDRNPVRRPMQDDWSRVRLLRIPKDRDAYITLAALRQSASLADVLGRADFMGGERHQPAVAPRLAIGKPIRRQTPAPIRLDHVHHRPGPVGPPLRGGEDLLVDSLIALGIVATPPGALRSMVSNGPMNDQRSASPSRMPMSTSSMLA